MTIKKRARIAKILLLLAPVLFASCNFRMPPLRLPIRPTRAPVSQIVNISPADVPNGEPPVVVTPTMLSIPTVSKAQAGPPGEPAGCLGMAAEQSILSTEENLAQADALLELAVPLSDRILEKSWNAYTQTYYPPDNGVLSLKVDNVQNKYIVQEMLNALHVAGYITWLRDGPSQRLHILAIPLRRVDPMTSVWAPYIQAYWDNSQSVPAGDPNVIPTLKLPPCGWMVEQGYAPGAAMDWWAADTPGRPDYASAAAVYLADTNAAAVQVARQIGWLGEGGLEAPNTMCGPLAWAILHDAGALPLDWGAWAEGPISFWLAKPRTNGRPWSLFPGGSYHVYSFKEPLGRFDFQQFPLYPGDFLYTYSEKDGFDHMMVITEVDGQGNVYTVTNLVQVTPEQKITIERLLLLNVNDPSVGIARNQWAVDRKNGRTGHDGFDVFRWTWAEKDIQNQPAAYTVQPGDTLRLVALRWHTPVEQIARYNGTTVDTALLVGQVLQIPPNQTTEVR